MRVVVAEPTLIEQANAVPPTRRQRFGVLYAILLVVALSLLARGAYLQLWQGSLFLRAAEGNRVAIAPITAPRGIMYDSRGTQLVENIASTDLVFDPAALPTEELEAPLIERLPELISVKREDVQAALLLARKKQRLVVVARALDHDVVLRLEEAKATLPGIRLVSTLVRKYPFSFSLAPVLGYTSPVTSEELAGDQTYIPTDITGKTGLEKAYDTQLHGHHGSQLTEVDAEGRPKKELGSEPYEPGVALTLTLDQQLQAYIYQLFSDRQEAAVKESKAPVAGAVIALDPRDGAVRALVSFPAYDPNVFSQPAFSGSSAELFTAPEKPLFNRGLDGEYPPGSTIKPFLAVAGLAEGIITPETTVLSTGNLAIGPWNFPDWKSGGHGQTNVKKALAESVNTFFYLLAGGDEQRRGLGVTKIGQYLKQFGWGEVTGLDVPSEAAGFIPTPDWKEKTKKERWYIGDTYHLGIGQGDVLVTPLQLATATAAVATGTWKQPHLVAKITESDQSDMQPAYASRLLKISATHLDVVREGMRQAVTEGSGRTLADLALPLAGKTGTAQLGGTDDTHAWFTSFGPYASPELVIVVLLERGGEGDDEAAPFAKHIWQWWLENRL